MTRRDFEIRAAEFFFSDSGISIEEQLENLYQLEEDDLPNGKLGIVIWQPFTDYYVCEIIGFIEDLANNYEEFYNMTNERFREE